MIKKPEEMYNHRMHQLLRNSKLQDLSMSFNKCWNTVSSCL